MLDVFRHAGFAVRRSLDAGVFDLEFDLSVPADGAVAERERIAETRSVALAPRPEGGRGDRCQPHPWNGRQRGAGQHLRERLYRDRASGQPACRERPWAEVLPVDRRTCPTMSTSPSSACPPARSRACSASAARRACTERWSFPPGSRRSVPAAHGTEAALVRLARRYGMRLIGPNCVGIINTARRSTSTPRSLRRSPSGAASAFVSQSGALGIAVLEAAESLGLGVSSFVSVGNKADVSGQRSPAVLGGRPARPTSSCCTSSRSATRASSAASPGGSRGTSRSWP